MGLDLYDYHSLLEKGPVHINMQYSAVHLFYSILFIESNRIHKETNSDHY